MAPIDKLTAVAEAIRSKTGKTESMTLEQMATEIAGIQTGDNWIGDGNTHIWISLSEGRTSPMLGVVVEGTVTVDWGDETPPDVLTGTSASAVQWTPTHEYAAPGEYIITLTVEGKMSIVGDTDRACILRCSSVRDNLDYSYLSAVQRVEIGDGVSSIGAFAFANLNAMSAIIIPDSVDINANGAFTKCSSLLAIDIPDATGSIGTNMLNGCESILSISFHSSVKNIGGYSISGCSSLRSVTIEGNVNSIGANAFYGCQSISSVVIRGNVNRIASKAFANCYCVKFYDFGNCTAIPSLGAADVFNSIAPDCEIRIPAALYDEWVAATNWSNYADYIVAKEVTE